MASAQGIRTRHSRTCASRTGTRCNCKPTYEAWVYSKRDRKKIRKSFPTLSAAKGWRVDALKEVKDKRLRAPSSKTFAAGGRRVARRRSRGPHPEQARSAVQAKRGPHLQDFARG